MYDILKHREEILKDLQWSAALSVEEVDKIRKKYELI